MGALWENFLISERIKMLKYENKSVNTFFWRSKSQAEVDYIEEENGGLRAYEIKWKPKKIKKNSFSTQYKTEIKLISKQNFQDFIFLEV